MRKAVKGLPLMCTETEAQKSFSSEEFAKPLWSPPLQLFMVKVDTSWSHQSAQLFVFNPFTPDPIGWRAARYPVEKDIPSTVRAAVFVLPNSIPFHSLSAHCLFWCFFTLRGLTDWAGKRKTSPSLPTRWQGCWKWLPLAQQKKDKGTIFSAL